MISSIKFSQFLDFLNAIKSLYPNLFTTEANWQAEVASSKLHQCGKFVIDDALATIRLPKVVNINGLQDLALLGGIKDESLPNIIGSTTLTAEQGVSGAAVQSGALTRSSVNLGKGHAAPAEGYPSYALQFDASLSSSTYQNNASVQQEAILYSFFIQVATGNDSYADLQTEVQLNNPFFFGIGEYFENEPNNASWLISSGQWNSGATYISFYNWLLEKRNKNIKSVYKWINNSSTVSTLSANVQINDRVYGYYPLVDFGYVKSISGLTIVVHNEYSNTDYSWTRHSDGDREQYILDFQDVAVLSKDELESANFPTGLNYDTDNSYVIDSSSTTFRLPLLNGKETLPSEKITDLIIISANNGSVYQAPANGFLKIGLDDNSSLYGQALTYSDRAKTKQIFNKGIAKTTDLTGRDCIFMGRGQFIALNLSSSTATVSARFIYAMSNGSLYFYVGETVQDANIIAASQVLTDVANIKNGVGFTDAGKSEISKLGLPGSRYIDLTLGASGSSYIAPGNGYFTIQKLAGVVNGGVRFSNVTANSMGASSISPVTGGTCAATIPAKTGDSVILYYSATGTNIVFRFVYAEGEQ